MDSIPNVLEESCCLLLQIEKLSLITSINITCCWNYCTYLHSQILSCSCGRAAFIQGSHLASKIFGIPITKSINLSKSNFHCAKSSTVCVCVCVHYVARARLFRTRLAPHVKKRSIMCKKNDPMNFYKYILTNTHHQVSEGKEMAGGGESALNGR